MFHKMPLKLYFMKSSERKVSQCILAFSVFLTLGPNNIKNGFYTLQLTNKGFLEFFTTQTTKQIKNMCEYFDLLEL